MQVNLSSDDKIKFLIAISQRMGVSVDEILAVYLLLQDKIFFLFDLFQGRSVKFPSMRGFHQVLSSVDRLEVLKLTKHHYLINGVDSYKEDIVSGDTVRVNSKDYIAMSSPVVFLEDSYILVKRFKEDGNE